MKEFILCLILALAALSADARADVTRFLGIPVDGSKAEMVQQLKAKGFVTDSHSKDVLVGEFNGHDVNVHIATNGNKVCRIMVCDATPVDERAIQIRFNNLCRQFEKNPKYISFGDYQIADDENIRYEIAVKNKRYEALFYQHSVESFDTAAFQEWFVPRLLEKYTPEELQNPTDEISAEVMKLSLEYVKEVCVMKPVWFMISEYYGKYYITMYYDNEYNRADGEDL